MPTFLVLLRGLNVGKANRVPMAGLKSLLLGIGCTSATTLLNSGNAVVQAPHRAAATLAAAVAAALEAQFGFHVPVIVVPATSLAQVVSECPFAHDATDHSRLLVSFAQDPALLQQLQSVAALVAPPERWAIGSAAAYLLCAAGILNSKAANALLGKAGKLVTSRNWATVLKLHALATNSAA